MKVILRTDIPSLGRQGDIKDVAPGYGRNYLLPRQLAWEATEANTKRWDKEKVKLEKVREQKVVEAGELAAKIEAVTLTIRAKVGEGGKLFGSVTNAMIVQSLADNGFTVNKHDILLKDPIKEVGIHTVNVRLHHDVTAKARVSVVAENPEGESTQQ